MQPKKDIEALNSIGARLSAERRRLDLTQEDLALRGGVKRQTQAHYEKGSRAPDGAYLAAISEAGVDILYVLVGRRERRPLDHDLLVHALHVVDDQLEKLGIELHPVIKARASVHLYNTFEGKSAVDPDVAEAFIKLAADASRSPLVRPPIEPEPLTTAQAAKLLVGRGVKMNKERFALLKREFPDGVSESDLDRAAMLFGVASGEPSAKMVKPKRDR